MKITTIFYYKRNGNIYIAAYDARHDFSVFGENAEDWETILDVAYYEGITEDMLSGIIEKYHVDIHTKELVLVNEQPDVKVVG